MYMFSLIMCFHIIRPKTFITILHLTGWFVQGEYFDGFLAICLLKFLGKLEQLDLAESCFEFLRPLVNTSIEQPISPHVPQLFKWGTISFNARCLPTWLIIRLFNM